MTKSIYQDMARLSYALDMLPRWLAIIENGEMPVDRALEQIRRDFADVPQALDRVRDVLYDHLPPQPEAAT